MVGTVVGRPEDITGEWLAGIVPGWPVGEVHVQRIGAERGIGGVVNRVTAADGTSVIVKLPIPGQQRSVDGLIREAGTYRWLASRPVGLGSPEVFLAATDAAAPVIVIEDVGHLRAGDDVAACTLDDAHLALEQLGRFHRQWWEQPSLSGMAAGGVAVPFRDFFGALADRVTAAVPPARGLARGIAGADGEMVVAALAERVPDIARLGDAPATLVHRDYRLDNLFFDGESVVVVDWANLTIGRGGIDVGGFVGRCLATAPTDAQLADLFATYRAAAGEAAGPSLDADVTLAGWYWLGWACVVLTTIELTAPQTAVVETWVRRLTPWLGSTVTT